MPKRRQKGSGGLYQRHDHESCPPLIDGERAAHKCRGRWVGTVDLAVDGHRRRKVVYGRTEKEARIKQRQAMQDKDAGALVLDTLTVEAWFTHWLDVVCVRRIKAGKMKPQTLRGYRSHVRNWVVPQLGRKRLPDLRPTHLNGLYDKMREAGKAEATVRQVHAIVKKALSDAEKEGKLARNPAARADAPGTATQDRESFDVDEARRVLAAAGDDARWWLALFYGMRQGECLGLLWRDVDFKLHTIRVEQTLQHDLDGRLFLGAPKSKTSRRTMPLVPLMEARLKLHAALTPHGPDDLVFPAPGGGYRDPKADWKAWRALIDRATPPPLAPLPYIALHAARNTAASLLEAAGVGDRLVAQILGHSQVRITHGYQTAADAQMVAAFDAYGDLLELD